MLPGWEALNDWVVLSFVPPCEVRREGRSLLLPQMPLALLLNCPARRRPRALSNPRGCLPSIAASSATQRAASQEFEASGDVTLGERGPSMTSAREAGSFGVSAQETASARQRTSVRTRQRERQRKQAGRAMRRPALVLGVGAALVASAEARLGQLLRRRTQSEPAPASNPDAPCGTAGDFDYHVLEMLWRPQYCLQQGNATWPGCVLPGRVDRLTVHGLWPSYTREASPNCSVPWPQFCPDRPAFDLTALFQNQALLTDLQTYWPDVQNLTAGENAQYEWFWQHEGERHGVCTLADQVAFFRGAVGLRAALAVPDEVTRNVGGYADAAKFNAAASGFATCASVDGNSTQLELRGISICYTPAPGSAMAGEPIDCPQKQYACPVDGTKDPGSQLAGLNRTTGILPCVF